MEHVRKFRPRPKHPTILTDAKPPLSPDLPAMESGATVVKQQPQKPPKRSAFRGLHLRSATKRARSPPPAALPSSPLPAVVAHDVGIEHVEGALAKAGDKAGAAKKSSRKKVKIPSFLTNSAQDLEHKFQELTWMERNRIAFGTNMNAAGEPKQGQFKHPDTKRLGMDRYNNIKPWSHNRVKLRVAQPDLDYVNASPITLVSSSNKKSLPPLRYIAMQGPTEQSIDYVWRMVAEQATSPVVIVQLTNMVENGSQKCFPYFPFTEAQESWRLNEDDIWNDSWQAHLRYEEMKTLAQGAIEIRKLAFRVQNEPNSRVVWHLLYTKWPDFSVPEVDDLDSFLLLMRLSKQYNTTDNPRIIHCSAGVGRTGTFIALEHLIRELDAGHLEDCDTTGEQADLVFKTVDQLRLQRKLMVQSDIQYSFIYQVLRKLWQDKYGAVEEAHEPSAKRLEVADPFIE